MFDSLIKFLSGLGYAGIGALMFRENILPPFPSAVVMPSAGFGAGQGRLGVIIAGTAGTVAGALIWYYIEMLDRFRATQTWGRSSRRSALL